MGKTRFEAFSDGVMAIILTIMVLELKVPHEPTLAALTQLWPVYLAYVIAFGNMLANWMAHHHLFAPVERIDARILLCNGVLLFFMSLVPFALDYGSEFHWRQPLPAAFYGVVMVLVCLGFAGLRAAVVRAHPERAAAEGPQIRASLVMAGVYLLGTAVAALLPLAALSLYAAVPLSRVLTAPQYRDPPTPS
ncbi:MAG: TMEM175 family protein [Ottowia sp.]